MTTSYSSISFQQIAASYNAINALPADAAVSVGRAIVGIAGPGARVLDMGCGAGRVALPAAAAGAWVVGADLELAMLRAAQAQAQPGAGAAFVRGDIVRMPFAGASFDTVLSINVLHLVPAWQAALAEARRVLKPGGVLVQGRDWLDPDSCAGMLRGKLREVVMALEPGLRPTAAAAPQVLARELAQMGGATEPESVAATWSTPLSPRNVLDQMAARTHNETWMLSDDLLAAALERLRAWADETWSDPAAPSPVERRFTLAVTRGLK